MQGSGSMKRAGPFEVYEVTEDCGEMTLTDSPVFAVGMMLAGLAACMIWYGFRLKKEQPEFYEVLMSFVKEEP